MKPAKDYGRRNLRVAPILVDYPNQARLKILGEARVIDSSQEPDIFAQLHIDGYDARVERGFVIKVIAYDWTCPQHITPRWTADVSKLPYNPCMKG
jgi:predicted pyridoxine 5'-phosphate oxidase superfamily flavin-nucleotide-binding protein